MFAKRLKFLAISTFFLGLVSVVISYGFQNITTLSSTKFEKRDIKVFYRVTFQSSKNSSPILQDTKYRLQKNDGSWKDTVVNYAPDGSALNAFDTYAINGKGIFAVSEKTKTLSFRAERPLETFQFSEAKFKASPNFIGETQVAGLRVLVQKIPYGDSDFTELYVSPDFNGLFLKIISKSGDSITTEEATAVKIEPISEEEFGNLPNYPINYGSYQNKIKSLESVNKAQAEQMKKKHSKQLTNIKRR